MDTSTILEIRDVLLLFGKSIALNKVSLQITKGHIHGLIGPNGAGKTSVLNCVSGIYHPSKGHILFKGREITDLKPYARQKLGLGRTFQNVEIFTGMTVLDCLMFGRHLHSKYNILAAGFYKVWAEREEVRNRRVVEEIVDFLEIENIRDAIARSLPYGLQKRVSLGIALALEPELLLLDEPMAGLNLEEREDMVRFIVDINEEKGITVLIVEHDMGVVMDISHDITVLNFGNKICEGKPEVVQSDPAVIKAYLGGDSFTQN